MIAVVDYGMGNLRSVVKAIEAVGGVASTTSDPEVVRSADAVVLPGVGAFDAAMANLSATGLDAAVTSVARSGRPVFGICLGMQLLFDYGEEGAGCAGLGLIPGEVTKLSPAGFKVPHIGWNTVAPRLGAPLFAGVPSGSMFYFVHSYAAAPADDADIVAECDLGGLFCCAVARGNISGTQFHPEKSGDVGLQLLRNFVSALQVVH